MRMSIMMSLDGAAFDDLAESEIARVLREVADAVEASEIKPGWTHVINDVNGNRIGVADVFGPDRPAPVQDLRASLIQQQARQIDEQTNP